MQVATNTSSDSRQRKLQLLRELESLEYDKASINFSFFFRKIWKIIEPKVELLYNWHHELIAEYLQACFDKEIKRLIVNMPPRYTKSNLITVAYPCWVWSHTPDERFMFASYSSGLSAKHGSDRRSILQSEWYQYRWNHFNILKDNEQWITNDKRGHMIATSMQGVATGMGGNYLVIDDPHDVSKVGSEVMRKKDNQAFDQKFTTRLDDKKNGVIIIVMQRTHEEDLTGHILAEQGEEKYEHLRLSGIAEKRTIVIFPKSKKEVVRDKDNILHSKREGKEELKAQKNRLGSYGFAGQYQQNPSPREGGILKRAYWMRYNRVPLEFDSIIDSWDCSFKDLQTSDFVAGEVWGIIGINKYLLHITKEKLGFIATLKAILKHRTMFPKIRKTLIEDKANGTAVIEVMKQKITGIIPFEPGVLSKTERAIACEPQLESGNVYLPVKDLATFDVDDFIDLCAAFPNAAFDDVVDAMTQVLIYLGEKITNRTKAMGLI